MRKPRLTLRRRRALLGVLFTLPFTIGLLLLFLMPMVQSVTFSLSELTLTQTGYELKYVGLKNFQHALFVQPDYVQLLVEEVLAMVSQVPLILIFSFFAATLLNQQFRGRTLARTVFFLPVIMGAGIILAMEQTDYIMQTFSVDESSMEASLFSGAAFRGVLFQLRLPDTVLAYIIAAVDSIPGVIRASGIQILIFLAGLQSIPRSLYEASQVEGATGWENFWLITFPMLSPLILTNVVYSIIDFLTGRHNDLLVWIQQYIFRSSYGVGTAMALMYFGITSVLLFVVVVIISRHVFYHE